MSRGSNTGKLDVPVRKMNDTERNTSLELSLGAARCLQPWFLEQCREVLQLQRSHCFLPGPGTATDYLLSHVAGERRKVSQLSHISDNSHTKSAATCKLSLSYCCLVRRQATNTGEAVV